MAQSDDPRYRYDRERDRIAEDLPAAVAAPIEEVLDALDPDVRSPTFGHNGDSTELTSNSLQQYGQRLRLLAKELDRPLLELTNDDLDELMARLLDGGVSIGPADGYSKGTVAQFESALKAFYRYHDGHDVDPEAIPIETQESPSIDERDLWTVEEVEAMRAVIDSKLDEAIFELLAYTGQRIRVIQTLRVKDVDPDKGDTGRYYVNETVKGRKNRHGHGPLLGAQGAVRRWLRVHPTKRPDDALITAYPRNPGEGVSGGATVGEPMSQRNIRRKLKRIAERAGVDKRVNPHMFRHYFSTVARRDFDMDPDFIKDLRGDAPGSNVFETTYRHLRDEDAASHAEAAFTGEEPETALTPAAPCSVCGEVLPAGAKACENCGAKRAPDAEKSEVEELRDRIDELEAEREIQQELGAAEALTDEDLQELAEDDALLAKLIELRAAG